MVMCRDKVARGWVKIKNNKKSRKPPRKQEQNIILESEKKNEPDSCLPIFIYSVQWVQWFKCKQSNGLYRTCTTSHSSKLVKAVWNTRPFFIFGSNSEKNMIHLRRPETKDRAGRDPMEALLGEMGLLHSGHFHDLTWFTGFNVI